MNGCGSPSLPPYNFMCLVFTSGKKSFDSFGCFNSSGVLNSGGEDERVPCLWLRSKVKAKCIERRNGVLGSGCLLKALTN